MMWKSAAAHQPEIHEAINQVVLDAYRDFDERSVDLVLLFLSSHHIAHALVALDLLTEQFPGATILGCSANSVIGAGEEIEDGPGVSLTLAHLPGVTLSPFQIPQETLARAARDPDAWRRPGQLCCHGHRYQPQPDERAAARRSDVGFYRKRICC